MDDAGLVRGLERFGNLPRNRQRLVDRKGAARDSLGEVLAVDELHDNGARGAGVLDTVDVGDVRMIKGRERLRLALESHQPIGIRRRTTRAGS